MTMQMNFVHPFRMLIYTFVALCGAVISSNAEGASMYYIVESDKTFEQAAVDLEVEVKKQGFGVLYVHDLGATLRKKLCIGFVITGKIIHID